MGSRLDSTGGIYDEDSGEIAYPYGPGTMFQNWCAERIQAAYKGSLVRGRIKKQKHAALLIQAAWRLYCYRREARAYPDKAATKIQRAWRAFLDVRLYKFCKDLVKRREKEDPAMLLRAINPSEANLVDVAAGIYIRFRLGGFTFPPMVYYKIFTSRPITDMNSFSPRDYFLQAQQQLKERRAKEKEQAATEKRGGMPATKRKVAPPTVTPKATLAELDRKRTEGWYRRMENNGWRPAAMRIFQSTDPVEELTAKKPVPYVFHHSKIVRREEMEKLKKQKRRAWLRQMYQDGKQQQGQGGGPPNKSMMQSSTGSGNGDDMDDDLDLEGDDDELLNWTQQLDFDAYVNGWTALATSSTSDDPGFLSSSITAQLAQARQQAAIPYEEAMPSFRPTGIGGYANEGPAQAASRDEVLFKLQSAMDKPFPKGTG
eukprot:jgi/Mesvir1/8254/Mv12525-RA.1